MAQITNISNLADSRLTIRSMTSSEDEDENKSRDIFLQPSLDINFSTKNDVINQCKTSEINQNDSDSITTDGSQTSTISAPQYNTYNNLSTSSSEASLSRPLLKNKHEDKTNTTTISPKTTTHCSTSNYFSSLKFYFTDMLMSAFVITPLVNIHWRGAWDFLDLYLLPANERTSALVSLGVSFMALYFIYLTQNFLQIFYEKHRKTTSGYIMTRIYTLIIALVYINQWRGLWNLLDLTSNIWYHLLIETLISVAILLLMKSIYSLNSAPFLIGVDTDSYFILGSKFKASSNRFLQYTCDFLFYETVEAPLVVIAWRGLYNLSDLYICPNHKKLSMLISFLIGYSFFFLLASLQILIMRYLSGKCGKFTYSLISNIFHLIAFISVVQIWRSLWMVCEQYINIPGYPLETLSLCYGGAYILLTCGLTSCSLNGPGGGKDNYLDDQPKHLYTFDYFSTLLQSQSKKKGKGAHVDVDSPSTEIIIPAEKPDQFEPP